MNIISILLDIWTSPDSKDIFSFRFTFRGLVGYRSVFSSDTRGTGFMHRAFLSMFISLFPFSFVFFFFLFNFPCHFMVLQLVWDRNFHPTNPDWPGLSCISYVWSILVGFLEQCFQNRIGCWTEKVTGSQFTDRTSGRTAIEPVTS